MPRGEWGAPAVMVARTDGRWVVSGKTHTVVIAPSDLAIRVQAGPATWRMAPSAMGDVLARSNGEDFSLRLADARNVDIRPHDTGFKTGVKLTLGGWTHKEADLDLTLFLTIALEGRDEELVFDAAAREGTTVLRQLDWPGPLVADDFDHTVLSHYRGILLPRNWPTEFHPIRSGAAYPNEATEIQSNVIESWSMSWWGFQQGPSAMMVIVETPDDAAYQFRHPAGGSTIIGPRWRASLGRFRYPRSARLCFFAAGTYVDLAKRYRRHAMDAGHFVSLKEKIARSPRVAALVGTPLTRLSILRNVHPDSSRYAPKAPEKNYQLTTFAEHPTSRSDSIKERAACFLWARQHLGIVGTEAAVDWTVPYVDVSSPLGPGRAGIPVPLFNLVYHDAVITPYAPANLHGFLNGGLPQANLASLTGDDAEKTVNQVRRMADLHQKIALLEMTRHEFLDVKHRVERTTFADGTTVTVDWDAGTYSIGRAR